MEKLFLSSDMPCGIKGIFIKLFAVGKQGIMSTIIVQPKADHSFPHDVWEIEAEENIDNAAAITMAKDFCAEQFPLNVWQTPTIEVVMKFPEREGTSYVFKVKDHGWFVED